MATGRYMRVHELETNGRGPLVLSEVQLWNAGARADGSVALTCTFTPTVGSLADLYDDDADTEVGFSRAQYTSPGFAFVWDFGSSQAIDRVLFGSGANEAEFVTAHTLSYSSDGITWTQAVRSDSINWPGANDALLVGGYPLAGYGAIVWAGADGTTQLRDETGKPVLVTGDAAVKTSAPAAFGGPALDVTVDGRYAYMAPHADMNIGSNDFMLEAEVYLLAYPILTDGLYRFSAIITRDDQGQGRCFAFSFGGTASSFTTLELILFNSGGAVTQLTAAHSFSLNTLYKVKVERTSNVVRFYVDGVQVGSDQANSTVVNHTVTQLAFGRTLYNSTYRYPLQGWMRSIVFRVGPSTGITPSRGGMDSRRSAGVSRVGLTRFAKAAFDGGFDGAKELRRMVRARDMEFSGAGFIEGTVKVDGDPTDTPVRRKVRLYRDIDGLLLRETWSDPVTGEYVFTEISLAYKYTVLTIDYNHSYRAAVADNITPEPMT